MAGDNCAPNECVPDVGEDCGGAAACGPGPGNVPVDDCTYQRSLGVRLQGTVDRARRISDRLGFSPYRVMLVWQERAPKRDWREVYRLELVPSKVLDMSAVARELGESGNYANGSIRVTEVSPAQVSEGMLRGQLPAGVQWGGDTHDREFFIEVQRAKRCATDAENPRHRFILGSEVHHDAEQFMFTFVLTAQQVPRGDGGVDRSLNLKHPHKSPVIVS